MKIDKKIFIHIPKNGGMTIRRCPELKKKIIVCTSKIHKSEEYTRGLEEKMKQTGDHHGQEHARFRDIRLDYREKYQSFAFVRNPWDRVVSRYFFAKKIIEVEKESSQYGNNDYANVSSFESFLEERFKWENQEYMWHRAVRNWYNAFEHVCDENGKVCCDILRFENYDEDIKKYMNINFNPKPRNVTNVNKGKYQDLYNEKTIQIVADWYKKDIDYWGFDFDTGATKNYWKK